MINLSKHVAIFSSPRVGSTWFQESLRKHFSMSELFSPSVNMRFKENKIMYLKKPDAIMPEVDIINYRIAKFNEFEKYYNLLSIKTHTFILNKYYDILSKFISDNNFQIIILDRRDRISTLISLLIANLTREYGGRVTPQSLHIQKDHFNSCIKLMNLHVGMSRKILQNYSDVKIIYYEDALKYTESEWWLPASYVTIQNAKAVTTFINKEEVDSWIKEIDFNIFNI